MRFEKIIAKIQEFFGLMPQGDEYNWKAHERLMWETLNEA